MLKSQISLWTLALALSFSSIACASKQMAHFEDPAVNNTERQVSAFLKDYSDNYGTRDSKSLSEFLSPEIQQKWGAEKIHELAFGPRVRGEPVIVGMIETKNRIFVRWYRGKLSFDQIQSLPWTHLTADDTHGFIIASESPDLSLNISERIRRAKLQSQN